MCPEESEELMQAVNEVAAVMGASRERILSLVLTMVDRFENTVCVIPKQHKKLEESLKLMEPELYTSYEETPKEKRTREKKEYREYLNRIHKGKRRHGSKDF